MAEGGQKRDPSSHRTPGQIKRHYDEYQGTPEQIKKRAQRNAARAIMVKKHGKAALKGKDVEHVNPLRRGGSNAHSNLKVLSQKKNRGWERE